MTYEQAYGVADRLVTMDGKSRYIVTDNGQERCRDNYGVVLYRHLDGRTPIRAVHGAIESDFPFVRLSEMVPGDIGYLPSAGVLVRLREGGLSGGAEHDLYLALTGGPDLLPADEYPTIIVDTDAVSGAENEPR